MTATRNVLGPLTTVFTQESTCVTPMAGTCDKQHCVAWAGQTCLRLPNRSNTYVVSDNPSCWPPVTPGASTVDADAQGGTLKGWGLYSPGLSCPAGHTSACTKTAGSTDGFTFQFTPAAGETAIGCCPTSFSCSLDQYSIQTCVRTVRSMVYDVVSCGGYSSPGTTHTDRAATASTFHALLAPMIQINWQPSDLPTALVAQPTDPNAEPSPARAGLDTGAKAGIGAGTAVAGLLLLGGVGWYMLLRRRRRRRSDGGGEVSGSIKTADEARQQQQLDSNNVHEFAADGQKRETHELFTQNPDGGRATQERHEME